MLKLALIWGRTPHIRIGLDTAHYSESGGDTAHNTSYYSESGGDTAQENVFRCSHWGGDTEFINRGAETTKNQSR